MRFQTTQWLLVVVLPIFQATSPALAQYSAEAMADGECVPLVAPLVPAVRPMIPNDLDLSPTLPKVTRPLAEKLRHLQRRIAVEQDPIRRAQLESELDEPTRVELVFSRQITQEQIDNFLALGGQIDYIFQSTSYGWTGTIPLRLIESISRHMDGSLVAVVGDLPAKAHLDEATRTGRARPVWATGFAGNPSGFSGSSSTTIAILDSGVDDSHTDLAGRNQYWKDWTVPASSTAYDPNGHGTHVAGIALGTGNAAGATTSTLYFTDSGSLVGVPSGSYIPSYMHIPSGLAVSWTSTATWLGGGEAMLQQIWQNDGGGSSYSISSNTTTSPNTTSGNFTSVAGRHYTTGLRQNSGLTVQSYAIRSSMTYQGVGDGFNTLRGVAPNCKWAGIRVLKADGSGTSTDIREGVDDAVTRRITHNIKVANLSLGIIGNPGLDSTLRSKVNTMVQNGIVAVCSAGNDGPGTGGANLIDDPGRAKYAITVGSTNDLNQLTRYTSSGFTNPDSTEDYKPDVLAPGGSDYYSFILSVDTNDSDAESSSFSDVQSNDYTSMMGTSMAAPFVAGTAALLVQALESIGVTWNFYSLNHPMLVKSVLCATATETNANREMNTGTNPTLGRAAAPKDLYEGYGIINPDAAIEALTVDFTTGEFSGASTGSYFDRRAWARKLSLSVGSPVRVTLEVPEGADYDLYLYAGYQGDFVPQHDGAGNPIIRASSTNAGVGVDEFISFTSSTAENMYLVIKKVSGTGTWKLYGSTVNDSIPPVPGTASSAIYANYSPILVSYSGASDSGGSGLRLVHLYYKKESGGTWYDSGLSSSAASDTFSFVPSSGEGTYYFDLVAEDYAGNFSSLPSGNGDCSTVYDLGAPTPGTASVPDYSGSSPIVVSYSGASDTLSGLKLVHLYYKKDSGAWTDSSLSSAGSSGSFNFVPTGGEGRYYFDLRAEDNAGNWSPAPSGNGDDNTLYDPTPPTIPVVTDDGAYVTTINQLHASWIASDAESGVAEYEYAISTDRTTGGIIAGGGWLSVGTATEHTRAGLSLTYGTTYFFLVRARNQANLWSDIGTSDGVTPVANAGLTVVQAKQEADGHTLGLAGRLVIAVFADCFYIADADQTCGIRVVSIDPPNNLAEGDLVDVGGTLQTIHSERHVAGASFHKAIGSGTVMPRAMCNKWVGGASWKYDPVYGSGQRGITNASGLNNIGLVVRTIGRVTYSVGDVFYIDDGSKLNDGYGNLGIRVEAPGLVIPPLNAYATVTGISSCFESGASLNRLILPRRQEDIDY